MWLSLYVYIFDLYWYSSSYLDFILSNIRGHPLSQWRASPHLGKVERVRNVECDVLFVTHAETCELLDVIWWPSTETHGVRSGGGLKN